VNSGTELNQVRSHPGVPLLQHLQGVSERARAFAESMPLSLPFDPSLLTELAGLCGHYHDLAKSTPFFQEYLCKKRPKSDPLTRHALPSAAVAFAAARKVCASTAEPWRTLLPVFAFMAVRAHHGHLRPLVDGATLLETDVLGQQLAAIHEGLAGTLPRGSEALREARSLIAKWPLKGFKLKKGLRSLPEPSIGYLVLNALFSCLIDADKLTTTLVDKALPSRADLPDDLINRYRQLHSFPEHKLNPLREQFYRELQESAREIELGGCYTITAPTGIGKTLAVLNAALVLRSRIEAKHDYRPRIIYALPFLSIIDQNASELAGVIKTTLEDSPTSDLILTHHHLSSRQYDVQSEHDFSDAAELLVEGWNSELVITTFYQVFHTLVGGQNRNLRRYHNLPGSILILDEVQSIPTKYWALTRHLLEEITTRATGLVLLSTATQPAILENSQELILDPARYYKHETLRRTRITYRPASQKLANLIEKVRQLLENETIDTLVVLNTVRDVRETYDSLAIAAQSAGYRTFYLTTHVTPKERLERIKAIRTAVKFGKEAQPTARQGTEGVEEASKPVLVVSTQLIEAGVDIDVARVVRDAAPFDSLLQIAGRANRHAERDVMAEIQTVEAIGENFRGSKVYDGTLLDVTRQLLEQVCPLEESNYLEAGQTYVKELLPRIDQNESEQHIEAIRALDYDTLGSFRLVEDEAESESVFIELDEMAQTLWRRYEALTEVKDRWERRRRFNEFRADFFQYVIQVRVRHLQKNLPPTVNGLLYVSLGDLETHYDSQTGFRAESESPQL
jgi:CRISPR-associated endonuclease/helicase Cas3